MRRFLGVLLAFAVLSALSSLVAAQASAEASHLPYRFLLVISDQWADPASHVIDQEDDFQTIAALLKTFHLMPTLNFSNDAALIDQPLSLNAGTSIQWLGKMLLTLAMAAIGLQVGLRSMLKTGRTAVLATLFTWIILSAVLLTVILLLP